jgi:hypothetical protein
LERGYTRLEDIYLVQVVRRGLVIDKPTRVGEGVGLLGFRFVDGGSEDLVKTPPHVHFISDRIKQFNFYY